MTFSSLASSSKGNAYVVTDGERALLLECGLSLRVLQKRLRVPVTKMDACFVTHEHKDHSRAADQLLRLGVPVYMSRGTAEALELNDAEIMEPGQPVGVGPFRVMAFPVWHDAREPVGYLLEDRRTEERLFFAADTRFVNYTPQGLTAIAVECNYERDLLRGNGRMPDNVKNRIAHSHFEVEDVIRWLHRVDLSGVISVYLMHLSSGNSRADLWLRRFRREFPGIRFFICEEDGGMTE